MEDLGFSKALSFKVQIICDKLRRDDGSFGTVKLREKVGDNGVAMVCRCLGPSTSAVSLILNGTGFGDLSAEVLQTALRQNTSLTELEFANSVVTERMANRIGDGVVGTGESNVAALTFKQCRLGDRGTSALCRCLARASPDGDPANPVAVLNLENNWIGAGGAASIARLLGPQGRVVVLQLEFNRIGDAGCEVLAEWLAENRSLDALYLGNNRIGPTGCRQLALALEQNAALRTLSLRNNRIGASGTRHLTAALEANFELRALDVSNNSIGDDGAKSLMALADGNPTLKLLHMAGNGIGQCRCKVCIVGRADSGHVAMEMSNSATALNLFSEGPKPDPYAEYDAANRTNGGEGKEDGEGGGVS